MDIVSLWLLQCAAWHRLMAGMIESAARTHTRQVRLSASEQELMHRALLDSSELVDSGFLVDLAEYRRAHGR